MPVDHLGIERLIQWRRVGPSHDLVLKTRVIHILEELAESEHKVALGDDDVHGEPHAQRTLHVIELFGDASPFAFERVSRVADQTVGGNRQDQAVERKVGTVGLQQIEEFLPLSRGAGVDLFEHEPAGRIENHGLVGEPPIHVDRTADALERILEPGRESHIAVPDRLGLARARLAHDHVPGEVVQILPGAAELLQSTFEVATQVVEPGATRRGADGLGRCRAVLDQVLLHGLGLFFATLLEQDAQSAEHDNKHDPTQDEYPPGAPEKVADAQDTGAAHKRQNHANRRRQARQHVQDRTQSSHSEESSSSASSAASGEAVGAGAAETSCLTIDCSAFLSSSVLTI